MEKIKNVTAEVKAAIKRKSAYTLPNNPTDSGYKANDIRKAFWQPIIDATNSAIGEVDRVVDEANIYLSHELKNIDRIESVAGNYYHSCIGLICTLTDEGFVVSGYKGDETSLVIPTHIYYDGKYVKVVEIAGEVFKGKAIENIEIPETVSKIGDSAFATCDNLSTVVFNGVLSLGNGVFNTPTVKYIVPREYFTLYKELLASYCTETQIHVKETIEGNRQDIESLQEAGAGISVELHGAKTDVVALTETVSSNTGKITELEESVESHGSIIQNQGAGLTALEIEVNKTNAAVAQNTSNIEGLRQDMQNESHFRGWVTTNAEVEALSGNANDYAYSAESGTVWVFENGAWTDSGKPVPDKATPLGDSTPLVNGEASPGTSENAAREDHRHPTDTTRASAEELEALSEKVDGLPVGGETEKPTVLTVDLSKINTLTVAFRAQQPNATKIDWGDGAVTTDFTEIPSHTYAEVGTYEIRIYGATELVGSSLNALLTSDCLQSLTRATIGDSVTRIGSYAFYSCTNLKYVTVPDSVTRIGSAGFYECPNLAKVVIGSGIIEIGGGSTFYYMPALLQLNAKTPPTIASDTFGPSSSDSIILVPRESVEAYRSAENWTSLAAQITANAWLSDLDEFVRNTDYATDDKAGIARWVTGFGLKVDEYGRGAIVKAEKSDIDAATNEYTPIVPKTRDYFTMKALSDCKDTEIWTDDSTDENGEVVKGTKTKTRELIGAVGNTDIANVAYNSTGKYDGVPGLFQYDGGMVGGFFKSTTGGDGKNRFRIAKARQSEIDSRTVSDYHDTGVSGANHCKPIVPANLDYAVIAVLTNALIALTEDSTDDEGNAVEGGKTKACRWLGALKAVTTTGASRLYSVNGQGVSGTINYNFVTPLANCIAGWADGGVMRMNDPIGDLDGVNKTYLLNLPDKTTLTDEQKAKWRAMLGIE